MAGIKSQLKLIFSVKKRQLKALFLSFLNKKLNIVNILSYFKKKAKSGKENTSSKPSIQLILEIN